MSHHGLYQGSAKGGHGQGYSSDTHQKSGRQIDSSPNCMIHFRSCSAECTKVGRKKTVTRCILTSVFQV